MHIGPLLRGVTLGATTLAGGLGMDKMTPLGESSDDGDAKAMAAFNLLILGPVVYAWVVYVTGTRRRKGLLHQVFDATVVVLVHSGLYAWIHRPMHRVKRLRPIHAYHHRYTTDVTPTVSNAVSPWEFLVAYLFPFAAACMIVRATEASLFVATAMVSVCNLRVHSHAHIVQTTRPSWSTCFVHPEDHLGHHLMRGGPPYAAPTVSWNGTREWIAS